MRGSPWADRPLLYAHRGASAERPENTLLAFERAREIGVDVLELDVHSSLDGVFVVSHDETGARTCNVPRRIQASSWLEISTWDAGWGFTDASGARPYAGRGIRPARFEEVVEAFPDLALNVDIKAATDEEVGRLIALLRERRAERRVLLTSFSGARLNAVRRAGYDGPIGLSRRDVLRLVFLPEPLLKWCGVAGERAQIPVRWGPIELTRAELIGKLHRLGLAVDYWVVNDAALARQLLERGADGIISDDPASIAPVLRAPRGK